uniref:Major facilitator superfamily (MFS) profile domain-containing protein n=1 Tax=Globodera rostochiensis TaxID=31243 RepID=A0A914HTK3_GLORO
MNRVGSIANENPPRVDGPTPPGGQQQQRTEWSSILLASWMAFISSVHFSLYFTSLWPYMKSLDHSASEAMFGVVVAAFSFTKILAAPALGIWSHRIERIRPPLLLCNFLMLTGNVFYFIVEVFPTSIVQDYVLICSRFITGAGTAQIALLRAHASAASTVEDRSRAIAFVTGGNAIGLSLGPAFQIAFSWLGFPGLTMFGPLHLSMFNCPALFAALLSILNRKRKDKKASSTDQTAQLTQIKLAPPDRIALCLCYVLRFTQQFVYTNIETIGTVFAMLMFMWSPQEVVFYESLAHIARGLLALLVYVLYIVFDLGKILNDRIICILSLVGLLLFHLVTFSWPFLPDNVSQIVDPRNGTAVLGCDRNQHPWCEGLKQVNVYVYYSLMIFAVGIAFPCINASMSTIFSKAVGPRLQAKQQSMLMLCGGLGRLLGPLMIGLLFTYYGPRAIWELECAVIILTVVLWTAFYGRLVPLESVFQNKCGSPIQMFLTSSQQAVVVLKWALEKYTFFNFFFVV